MKTTAQARFKFRLWDKQNKEYKKGFAALGNNGKVYREFADPFDGVKNIEHDWRGHYTIEKCTGVEDKHGKLIYEGDVLLLDDGYVKTKIRVKWHNDSQMFEMPFLAQKEEKARRFKHVEIVGNIHEKEIEK